MAGLKGQLLIANGGLHDPNFRQTVVLVAEHDENGALGIVLNRPADISVERVVPPLASIVDETTPLFFGGPVQPDSAVVVAEADDPEFLSLPVFGAIGILTGDVSEDTIARIRRARVFAGYAAWGARQLDGELARNDWILEPALVGDVFSADPSHLWGTVLRRKGGKHAMLATMPFDPTTN